MPRDAVKLVRQDNRVQVTARVDYDGPLRPGNVVIVTDAFDRQVDAVRVFPDIVYVDDRLTRALSMERSYADPVAVADAFARQFSAARAFADGVGVADTFFASRTIPLLVADVVTVADSFTANLGPLIIPVNDGVIMVDSGSFLIFNYSDPSYFATPLDYVIELRTF